MRRITGGQGLVLAVVPGRGAMLLVLVFLYEALPEELVFRGYLQRNLHTELPAGQAVVVQGVLFIALRLPRRGRPVALPALRRRGRGLRGGGGGRVRRARARRAAVPRRLDVSGPAAPRRARLVRHRAVAPGRRPGA
ncbi:hypothetical protein CXR04_08720 [Streptomyces sp. CMB-StM0423]|nr:hypothetical protein CXR04_08720 [Streptomyces sp. CMB-StM0423]